MRRTTYLIVTSLVIFANQWCCPTGIFVFSSAAEPSVRWWSLPRSRRYRFCGDWRNFRAG